MGPGSVPTSVRALRLDSPQLLALTFIMGLSMVVTPPNEMHISCKRLERTYGPLSPLGAFLFSGAPARPAFVGCICGLGGAADRIPNFRSQPGSRKNEQQADPAHPARQVQPLLHAQEDELGQHLTESSAHEHGHVPSWQQQSHECTGDEQCRRVVGPTVPSYRLIDDCRGCGPHTVADRRPEAEC
jgi:hypothetical protein